MRYKIVPVEPTEEMSEAGHDAICDDHDQDGVWRYMLAAASKTSEDEGLVGKVAFVLCEYDEEYPGTCGCGGQCTNTHSIGQARAVLKMLESDSQ